MHVRILHHRVFTIFKRKHKRTHALMRWCAWCHAPYTMLVRDFAHDVRRLSMYHRALCTFSEILHPQHLTLSGMRASLALPSVRLRFLPDLPAHATVISPATTASSPVAVACLRWLIFFFFFFFLRLPSLPSPSRMPVDTSAHEHTCYQTSSLLQGSPSGATCNRILEVASDTGRRHETTSTL